MRRGQAIITHQALREALRLRGDEVVAVWQDLTDQLRGTFRVLLGGGDLPLMHEGEEAPVVYDSRDSRDMPGSCFDGMECQ